jgi:hypothetical protein
MRPSPLKDFMASLERMLSLPDALLLPAHGACDRRVHDRVRELLEFHESRLDLILRVVRQGEANALQVASQVPWTRRGVRLSTMSRFNRMLAVLETVHHLQVLLERGMAEVRTAGDVLLYRVRS